MRIVVTGGAGFIGANLLHYLARTHPKDTLVTLDKLTYAGNRSSIRDLERSGKVDFIRGDIGSFGVVERTLRGADVVIHLAAETHVDRSIADAAPFLSTNVTGTWVLLESCRRLDIDRFYLVSTDEVMGSLPLDRPNLRFQLSTRYDPRSPYSASKAAADHLARAYYYTYGLPVVISNCGNNYGPYQHPEKLIPLAITHIMQGRKVPLYGDGKNVRDWIHVEDHCRAIDTIARKGKAGDTYLVGAKSERSNIEVLSTILALMGKGEDCIEHVADRPGHDRRYAIDPSYLVNRLGWKPLIPFEKGVAMTVKWYMENRKWWEPLVGVQKRKVLPPH
jgi:dTDP-glucose 4,6-dehydratase